VRNAPRSTRDAAGVRLAGLGVVVLTERSAEVALWVGDISHRYELAVQVGAEVIRPPILHPTDDYGTPGSPTPNATKSGS